MEDRIARTIVFATEHAPALAHAALSTMNGRPRRFDAVYCTTMIYKLDDLEVPQPPYRMPRPVARFAAAEEPPKLDDTIRMPVIKLEGGPKMQVLNNPDGSAKTFEIKDPQINPEIVDEIVEQIKPAEENQDEEKPYIDLLDKSWEQFATTPEQVDAKVLRTSGEVASEALSEIQAGQSEPTPIQKNTNELDVLDEEIVKSENNPDRIIALDEQRKEIESLQAEPAAPVSPVAETKGNLNSLKEERGSTEAAFRRAQTAGDEKEQQRLFELLQKYDAAIQKTNPPVEVKPKAPEPKPEPEKPAEVGSEMIYKKPFNKTLAQDKSESKSTIGQVPSDEKVRIPKPEKVESKEDPFAAAMKEFNEAVKHIADDHPRFERAVKAVQDAAPLPKQEAPKKEQPEERPLPSFLGHEAPPVPENLPTEPEQPERPRKERMGGFTGFLREGARWVVEKSGVKPWLDTLAPRLESRFHRRMAGVLMMQQSRAQNKLETAEGKLDDWKARMENSGFPMRLFYANRVRKWQARVNKAEARVNKYDASRQKWQERHNDLQRQVSERYDRELEPYIEQMNDLKTLETSAMQARKDLEAKRSGAVKKLVQLRAQATRKHWWQSTRASIEVKKAEKAIKDIEALIAKADKEVARIRAPLAKAKASADKWELKKKTVAQLMEFPQAAGLGRRTIKRIPTPEQKGVEI